jgi:hypothetical protein
MKKKLKQAMIVGIVCYRNWAHRLLQLLDGTLRHAKAAAAAPPCMHKCTLPMYSVPELASFRALNLFMNYNLLEHLVNRDC